MKDYYRVRLAASTSTRSGSFHRVACTYMTIHRQYVSYV